MRQGRLLIVDDDPIILQPLESYLTEKGHEVLAVESATAALNRIDVFGPDLVLSDVRMPGMDGLELLAHLREARPDVDVVIFTGSADAEGAIEAVRRGAADYLVKPLNLDEVERVIEQCLLRRAGSAGEEAGEALESPPHGLVGRHPSMVHVYKTIGAVAPTPATILIRGETGTGKELIARAIHDCSQRAAEPFIAVNCAAVPENLLESELFGHVRGAFTGAAGDRSGKFEAAGRGTLFLDEIGDTSPAFQAKLLRVLQEKTYYPLGTDRLRETDARVMAATHRSLAKMVTEGAFREDLLYRLQVIEIEVPPLRERRSDIPLLVRHLVARAAGAAGRTPPAVGSHVMEELVQREWPGNVRELENVLTRAVLLTRGAALTLADVSSDREPGEGVRAPGSQKLSEVRAQAEQRHVQRVLHETGGNKSSAARTLGISRPTLNRIIRDHQLIVP